MLLQIESEPGADERTQNLKFVERLLSNKIHPVLVFGTSASGKTTLLHSLVAYARQKAEAALNVRLGTGVYPEAYDAVSERHQAAERFFGPDNAQFCLRQLPPPTQRSVPFFIPLDIEHKGRAHRVAFLEGMGEWYHLDVANAHRMPPFKSEIQFLMREFEGSLSVIVVVPSRTGNHHSQEYTDQCLEGVLTRYDEERVNRHQDRLLLVASKWDMVAEDRTEAEAKASIPPSLFLRDFKRWKATWAKFHALGGFAPGNKAVMPFSIGKVADEHIWVDNAFDAVCDRFDRTLWNWIFEGVQKAHGRPDGPGMGTSLYPDVGLPPQSLTRVHDGLVARLLGIRER